MRHATARHLRESTGTTLYGDAIENGVDAMTIMRRGRLLPRYQQLLQRLLNNCVVDGDYRCTDGQYVRAAH